MTVSHVMNVFLRMMLWLGEGACAGSLPVFRSMLSFSECSRLWSAACAQGLVTTKREDIRDTKKALEHFAQQARGSEEFEAKQGAARNMFLVQDKLDVDDAEAGAAEACRVKSVEDMQMGNLVEVLLWCFYGNGGV